MAPGHIAERGQQHGVKIAAFGLLGLQVGPGPALLATLVASGFAPRPTRVWWVAVGFTQG
jgi:hypothetical protein